MLAHRLSPSDPLAPEEAAWERQATDALLGTRPLMRFKAAAQLA